MTPLSPSLDLPLLKILGIRAPLSIQLHPDSGIAPFLNKQFPSMYPFSLPLSSPSLHPSLFSSLISVMHNRYKDPCAKPEMVIPITPLLVMMGVKQYHKTFLSFCHVV